MKKTILKLSLISFVILIVSISFTTNSNNANNDVSLCQIVNLASAQAEEPTGTGDCGTGYMYFCGYFDGIDHPDFYAYEGPWLT